MLVAKTSFGVFIVTWGLVPMKIAHFIGVLFILSFLKWAGKVTLCISKFFIKNQLVFFG